MPTAHVQANLTLGNFTYPLRLRILAPHTPAQRLALGRIPSMLGRDMLGHFALFMEERTGRVLLLEPHEANELPLS